MDVQLFIIQSLAGILIIACLGFMAYDALCWFFKGRK